VVVRVVAVSLAMGREIVGPSHFVTRCLLACMTNDLSNMEGLVDTIR
jgi:hypothetical protein